jgi:hypothetical protein
MAQVLLLALGDESRRTRRGLIPEEVIFGWADEKLMVIALSRLVCMAGSESREVSENSN